jgi:hypothetical protein
MKHVISFKTPVLYKYGTVALDLSNVHLFVDSSTQTVWVDDASGATAAFDAHGIDTDEYTIAPGDPAVYNRLLNEAIEAARAAAEAAETMAAMAETEAAV